MYDGSSVCEHRHTAMAARKILSIDATQVMKNLPYREVVVLRFNNDNCTNFHFSFEIHISGTQFLTVHSCSSTGMHIIAAYSGRMEVMMMMSLNANEVFSSHHFT